MTKRATVSFTDKDLERLNNLKDALDIPSTAQVISFAIKLADEIRKEKQTGGEVIFEKGRKKRELIIPGLEKS